MCQIGGVKKTVHVEANKPLTVYRQFRVNTDGSLRPIAFSYRYKPGTNKTTIPRFNRGNGFWAYHTEGALVRSKGKGQVYTWHSSAPGAFTSDARINVRVKVWGRVALHTRGVRAEYMAIAPRVFVRAKAALRTAASKGRPALKSALRTMTLPTFS